MDPDSQNDLISRIKADLAKCEQDFAVIEARLTALRVERAELEVAARILSRYLPTPKRDANRADRSLSELSRIVESEMVAQLDQEFRRDIRNDLFRKTIRESARCVLQEIGRGEYGEIARIALEWGYRSHKSGDNLEKITRSFYETMRRNPSEFLQLGSTFALREDDASPDRAEDSNSQGPATHLDEDAQTITHDAAPESDEPPELGTADPAMPAVRFDLDTIVTDATPDLGPAESTATIDWGDGTTSAGTIVVRPGGVFEVGGNHAYARPGVYPLNVTLRTTGRL